MRRPLLLALLALLILPAIVLAGYIPPMTTEQSYMASRFHTMRPDDPLFYNGSPNFKMRLDLNQAAMQRVKQTAYYWHHPCPGTHAPTDAVDPGDWIDPHCNWWTYMGKVDCQYLSEILAYTQTDDYRQAIDWALEVGWPGSPEHYAIWQNDTKYPWWGVGTFYDGYRWYFAITFGGGCWSARDTPLG